MHEATFLQTGQVCGVLRDPEQDCGHAKGDRSEEASCKEASQNTETREVHHGELQADSMDRVQEYAAGDGHAEESEGAGVENDLRFTDKLPGHSRGTYGGPDDAEEIFGSAQLRDCVQSNRFIGPRVGLLVARD